MVAGRVVVNPEAVRTIPRCPDVDVLGSQATDVIEIQCRVVVAVTIYAPVGVGIGEVAVVVTARGGVERRATVVPLPLGPHQV